MTPIYPEETSEGTSYWEGFDYLTPPRPSTIDCTFEPPRDLPRFFPWPGSCPGISFTIFGAPTVRSNSATSTRGTRRVSGAPAREGRGIPKCGDLRRPVLSFPPAGLFSSPH
ncbi:hypothetical protein JTE90_015045 [Oedothorax gibbosus]|uniref:Uncharacterized protein n=1 Tax=Oedothorax gibbosus TaxID=931172 RepID=A0AAV6TN52_9ARAC|nr:hypothetical protein JTE90_015045 [Oedothorax gibbosus]